MKISSSFLNAIHKAPNPAYVLDESLLVDNLTTLRKVQTLTGTKVLCALKGYSMWSSFPLVKQYLEGATASSLNEVRLCYQEMGVKAHACFVVYLEEEFEEVLSKCSHITFNSLNQYDKFKKYITQHPTVEFALRINPEYAASEVEKYNTCMPGSRFGILSKDLSDELPEGITGIHFHALCENDSSDLEKVLHNVEEKFGHLLHQATWVNMGGGHHITRKNYDLDLLYELLNNFKANYQVQLYLEPGEAVGWETGVLSARVEDLVENSGTTTAVLNISFAAHMPDCLEMPYQPSVVGTTENGYHYALGGNTCMSGDFVENFSLEKELNIGDTIIFKDMMHYTFVKNNTFNGVPLPAICTYKLDGSLLVNKTFSYEDFKGRLS